MSISNPIIHHQATHSSRHRESVKIVPAAAIPSADSIPEDNSEWTDADEIADLCGATLSVVGQYYAELVSALRACLAVVASLALKGRTLPLCLIFEGVSGYGKTAVLQMFFAEALLNTVIYRSDKFTPKAFVSHASTVKRTDLAAIDLLPKLDGRTLVTKELAPLFRGKQTELVDTFANLCTVLDGKGLSTDSGTQGQRGYRRYLIFNWLGATTPVPAETHELMYQLGTRLLFYEIDSVPLTAEDLFNYLKKDESKEAEDESRKAVKVLLTQFFKRFRVDTVEPESVTISDPLLWAIANWSDMIASGRAELKRENDGSGGSARAVAANTPEAARKIGNYLKQLARGSALISGRTVVNAGDVEIVAHVAISSIPCQYRPIVRELRQRRVITSTEAVALCKISAPTARKYLHELSLLGFGTLEKGGRAAEARPEKPDTLTRATRFDWMTLGKA